MTPMATTLAPTTPVDAAKSAPIRTVLTASPPLTLPKRTPIDSSSLVASSDFCRIIPININSGTAMRILFVMMENIRNGIMENICKNSSIKSLKVPPSGTTSKNADRAPKNIETAPKVKATG